MFKKLTIDEIAKKAGVSKATVSRVLNNKPDVKTETKERIEKIIGYYQFKPNAYAAGITKRKSRTIGLLAPQGTEYIYCNPFFSKVLHGISVEVNKRGYYLMFCYVSKEDYVDVYQRNMVDGFIVLSPGTDHQGLIKRLIEVNVPFVSTSVLPDLESHQFIDIDNRKAARMAVGRLLELGHRDIALINSFSDLMANKERFKGYLEALEESGIIFDANLVKEGPPTFENGYKQVLAMDHTPDAIFACSDMEAFGAIEALKTKGVGVPTDVSVIGFDDIDFAANFGLSTVRQPIYEKGVLAANMLIRQIEGKRVQSHSLEVELVERTTTMSRSSKNST